MNLHDRIRYLESLFIELEETPGRNDKHHLVERTMKLDKQLSDDLTYCLEVLDGRHKLGYRYFPAKGTPQEAEDCWSLKEYLKCLKTTDVSEATIYKACAQIDNQYWQFVYTLVNREWRLGIGKSVLGKDSRSPMLAKKFDYDKIGFSKEGYYVTEKLDGNRCVAEYNEEKQIWQFWSRSGKSLNVNFNMAGFSKEYLYDGEILSPQQVAMSCRIYDLIKHGIHINEAFEASFNATSGLINQLGTNKKLIYNVFDIISPELTYIQRRKILDCNGIFNFDGDVRVVPLLAHYSTLEQLKERVATMLDKVTTVGAEGLMVNLGDRRYEQKRTDAILKLKQTQTMDMLVVDYTLGTGKNESLVGSITCECKSEGKIYKCAVGSGLSDQQRQHWIKDPNAIIGKIVEVAYFSISQDSSAKGTNRYSLRFPRLKRLREDKTSTSTH